MSPVNLDRIDRRILSELDGNARTPLSDIARKLRLGRDIVTYRFERLQKEGVLRRFLTVINPYVLGYSIFKTYLKLEPIPAQVRVAIAALKKHPRLIWLAHSDGSWDLMIGVMARSPQEYWSAESVLFQKFGALFSKWETSSLVETHIYNRQFLSEDSKPKFLILGGSSPTYFPDKLEEKLLAKISDNARIPVSQLAEILDTTPDIIRSRIGKLEKVGAIIGYRTDVDLSRIGLIFIKAMISLKNWGPDSLQKFELYCSKTKHVTYFIRQIGRCQIELEMEVTSYAHYYELLDQIKQSFPDLIRDVETAFMRDEFYKWAV